MTVTVAEDIVSALQHVEADRELSAIVCDRRVLGEEADALLKAIIKLRPRAGSGGAMRLARVRIRKLESLIW